MPETIPDRDGANVRLPPPVVALTALVVGVAVHAAWPFSLPIEGLPRWSLGAVAVALGLAAMAAAMGLFRRTGQDPKPWAPTPEIVSAGVYRLTRNPMYLGMALIQTALGIGLGNGDSFEIHSVAQHMHLLGRSGRTWVERADGSKQCLLQLDDWDFGWQESYQLTESLIVNPGDKLHLRCEWDNSAEAQPVIDGEQAAPIAP